MDPYGHDPYAAAPAVHYPDDGLGGLGGPPDDDDGLGTGYDAPPPPVYQDDGLMFMADLQPPPGQHGGDGDADMLQQQLDDGAAAGGAAGGAAGEAGEDLLGAAIDAAFEEGQDGPGRSSRAQQHQDDSDAVTEDDEADESDEGADGGDAAAAAEDPAVAEQLRQNAFARQCYDAMTEAQRNRLEAYRTSNLPKKTMRKVVQELTGVLPGKDLATVALCSVTKMFVGEVVETARQIAAAQGHTGALLPSHIRAAHQALCEDNRVARASGPRKPLRLY